MRNLATVAVALGAIALGACSVSYPQKCGALSIKELIAIDGKCYAGTVPPPPAPPAPNPPAPPAPAPAE